MVSLFPAAAPEVAAMPQTFEGFVYSNDGDSIRIVSYSNFSDLSVEVPDTIGGKPVTSIKANAFQRCYALEKVTLPASIETVGTGAFSSPRLMEIHVEPGNKHHSDIDGVLYNKDGSTLVAYPRARKSGFTIPDHVKTIGKFAFSDSMVRGLDVPDSVTAIEEGAFKRCEKLREVRFGKGALAIGSIAFFGCGELSSITFQEGLLSIGERAFNGCGPTTVRLPESLMSIGKGAFRSCWQLSDLSIGSHVASIGDYAFADCGSLGSVTIPNGVLAIGRGVFLRCASLATITLPDAMTFIGDDAFAYCQSLTSITLPDTVASIGDRAFAGCGAFASVILPEGLESIGASAFAGCSTLAAIEIPDRVTSLGDHVFAQCGRLAAVTIGKGVVSMGGFSFQGCESLVAAHIPDNVASIGEGVFDQCKNLATVTIGNGVVSIPRIAFSNCKSLNRVEIGSSVESIRESAFHRCESLERIVIPDGVTEIGTDAFRGAASLAHIEFGSGLQSILFEAWGADVIRYVAISPDHPKYTTVDDIVYDLSGARVVSIPPGRGGTVTLPDGVVSVNNHSIGKAVERLHIPSSVALIGEMAFDNSRMLRSCTVDPGNLKYSSLNGVLYNKNRSRLIRYPLSRKGIFHRMPDTVSEIDHRAFHNCKGLYDVSIPPSVVRIGKSAFDRSGLRRITIPRNVRFLGDGAFNECRFVRDGIVFEGDAPDAGENIFGIASQGPEDPASEVRVLHLKGADGFESGPWDAYTMVEIQPAASITVYPALQKELVPNQAVVDLGDATAGGMSRMEIILKNSGAVPLRLPPRAVHIAGADSASFRVLQPHTRSVQPGMAVGFQVAFLPGEIGLHRAHLEIRSNDPDHNPFVIRLKGTGL